MPTIYLVNEVGGIIDILSLPANKKKQIRSPQSESGACLSDGEIPASALTVSYTAISPVKHRSFF